MNLFGNKKREPGYAGDPNNKVGPGGTNDRGLEKTKPEPVVSEKTKDSASFLKKSVNKIGDVLHKKFGSTKHTTDAEPMSNTEYLGEIYKLMVKNQADINTEREENIGKKKSDDRDEEKRHKEIIKALTLRRKPTRTRRTKKDEKSDKDKVEKDKSDTDKVSKDRADKDKATKDKASKDKAAADKAKADKDKADKAAADKAKADKDKADKAKADKDKADKEAADKAKADKQRELQEKEKQKQLEKERTDAKSAKDEADRKAKEAKTQAEKEAAKREQEAAQKKLQDAEKAKQKATEEAAERARQKAADEAQKKAAAEAKKKAEEEAKKKAEEEARKKAEEEARKKAEEEAKKLAEKKAKKEAEEKARKAAEEKARKEAEEKARKAAEEKARTAEKLKEKPKSETATQQPPKPPPKPSSATASKVAKESPFLYAATQNPKFMAGLGVIATNYNSTVPDLLGFMMNESRLNPAAQNEQTKATGLIQIMPATLDAMKKAKMASVKDIKTVDDLKKLSAEQQLPIIEDYFKLVGLEKSAKISKERGSNVDLATLYSAVFLPAFKDKPNNFVMGIRPGETVNGIKSSDILFKERGHEYTYASVYNGNAAFDIGVKKDKKTGKYEGGKGFFTKGDIGIKAGGFNERVSESLSINDSGNQINQGSTVNKDMKGDLNSSNNKDSNGSGGFFANIFGGGSDPAPKVNDAPIHTRGK